jgi:hypothetical protein
MAEHFYDTSAAVKHYRAELGTAVTVQTPNNNDGVDWP